METNLTIIVITLLLPDLQWGRGTAQALAQATGKPLNPHKDCGLQPSWWKGRSTKRAFVRGLYEYNHYMQDTTTP